MRRMAETYIVGRVNAMSIFRRPRDGDDEEQWVPTDDMADFCLSERQRQIRKVAETRKVMEKLWAQIQDNLRHPWRQP
jgi:hypothetical protein